MKRQKFSAIFKVLVATTVTIIFSSIFLGLFFQYEIDLKTQDKVVPMEINTSSLDKPMRFSVYPWSKYKQGNIREPDEAQKAFLQEKKLAECIVDLVNYDGQLISDKENAKGILYHELRVLNAEGREYYVLYQVEVEGISVFAMIDMEGKLFSFHYVTDCEYEDGGEAIEYVMEEYESGKKAFSLDDVLSEFHLNRDLFVRNTVETLTDYSNINTDEWFNNVDFWLCPDRMSDENGSIMLGYILNFESDRYIYFYMDKQSKKFSGYHIEIRR